MTAHQADILYLSLSLALPILAVAVIRKGWIAIPLAIFAHWSILDAAGDKLQELDPERDAGMADSIWSVFGILQAVIFVSILWAIKQFIVRIKNKKKPNQSLQP